MPDLSQLLPEWAELEPERGIPAFSRSLPPGCINDAALLYATIQAIEARGWMYHLFHDGVSTCATIEIHRMIQSDAASSTWGHVGYGSEIMTDSPAAALLAAYLEALKQEVSHA